MKLESFDQSKKNKKFILNFFLIGLVVTIVIVASSYALYEKRDTLTFVETKVGDFGDVNIAFTINGEKRDTSFPNKEDGYIGESVTCSKEGVTATWNNVTWSLENIVNNDSSRVVCNVNFVEATDKNLSYVAKVGDYVSMTPSANTFTIQSDLTGFTDNQQINPQLLKLWRILKINDDGSIEAISEYVSYEEIKFYGKVGYKNYVGTLNLIASAYQNIDYVQNTRYHDYIGETNFITDTSALDSLSIPWACSTYDFSCTPAPIEHLGGGYRNPNNILTDRALVTSVYSDRNEVNANIAYIVDSMGNPTTETGKYFSARRNYTKPICDIVYINDDGNGGSTWIYNIQSGANQIRSFHLRPILVFRPNLIVTGTGQQSSPYTFN